MSENYNQNSRNIKEDSEKSEKQKFDFSVKPHEKSNIKKVIGIVSGKGGVGKSIVTSMLAVTMNKMGYRTAIMDADLTGPSIPKSFGISEKATGSEIGIFPVKTESGISIMSINLLLANDTDPVVWRGPILSNTIKQFWTDIIWGDLDFLFIDLPPGTGDIPLTIFQSIAINGIIVVTSPQELVSMIVLKAIKMADMMNIPIIGLVENMSYFKCPDNNREYKIFGESHIDEIAEKHNLKVLAKLPVDPEMSAACDKGAIEFFDGSFWLGDISKTLEEMIKEK
ncbi:MAG: Mrp/NBP35 family ATP-binding protein [Spirochaetes bacterium]|nr:Mrp/NBP35 family ATP-binding protein [Spirochaetota bacterium]MBP8991630.1 Mrp/NBP35 family ATP-binding protein [Spirochaetota bacterium]HOV46203.1 Mrp/NBP35 family ATP-binding protein [Exilispira sp.]HQJ40064.1 Mrp/NBP35 family ATP-binding protein [Exilispira sp.]HQQ19371.1 Mrp/NBP35 family ATP-binding protein [Exilispira sp.]